MTAQKKDIFDVISQETDVFDVISPDDDIFEQVEAEDAKSEPAKVETISEETKDFIRAEVAKIKPTQSVIERVIETRAEPVHIEPRVVQAPAAPPQIIKEVRIEVEKKDQTKYAKEDDVEALKERIEGLVKQLAETRRMAEAPLVIGSPGGSGVIGIPPPEGNEGKVLTVVNRKAAWVTSSSGGSSSDAYTASNVTTDRSFDASNTSLDEIANVLGSLIASLQGAGVIQ